MRNRAKCKKCNSIIESKHVHDYVSCSCGEIAVDGGLEYFKVIAKDFDNFMRVDDAGNEIIVTVKEKEEKQKPSEPPAELSTHDLIKLLDNLISNVESLPPQAMTISINHYDYYSLLMILSSIFKSMQKS